MTQEDEHDEHLPERLTEALRNADRPPPLITARVDRELTAMAAEQFAGRRRYKVPRPAWAAMAAAVLVAVLVVTRPDPAVDSPAIHADVDGSGQMDIADVLALARTQPGRYTQAELDAFAMRIVALDPGGDAS